MHLKKRKNNNKFLGFTFIELLTVIVILSIILLIIVINVMKIINKSKKDSYVISVKNLVAAVKNQQLINDNDFICDDENNYNECYRKFYYSKDDYKMKAVLDNKGNIIVYIAPNEKSKYFNNINLSQNDFDNKIKLINEKTIYYSNTNLNQQSADYIINHINNVKKIVNDLKNNLIKNFTSDCTYYNDINNYYTCLRLHEKDDYIYDEYLKYIKINKKTSEFEFSEINEDNYYEYVNYVIEEDILKNVDLTNVNGDEGEYIKVFNNELYKKYEDFKSIIDGGVFKNE